MADGRGLPLLSGPPPPPSDTGRAEIACRKCSKEFNMIFARARRCNHCGYSYCYNCSDYLALMPRGGNESGYDAMNVCAYCIEFLTITAAGRGHLKTMPLAKLRKYVNAYNIKVGRVVEKDDLIDRIVAARQQNGCLSQECEMYYRRYSVPSRPDGTRPRGLFSSRTVNDLPPATTRQPPRQSTTEFPRPDLAPDELPPQVPPRPQYAPPPGPSPTTPRPTYSHNTTPPRPPPRPQYYNSPPQPPQNSRPPPPPHESRPQHSFPSQGPYSRPAAAHSSHNLHTSSADSSQGSTPRQRAASATVPSNPTQPPPPPSPPTLEELLEMPSPSIAALSISNLKAILFANHVNAGLVLEKAELVKKVTDLVEDERRDRERQRIIEEQEDQVRIELQRQMMEDYEKSRQQRESESHPVQVDEQEARGEQLETEEPRAETEAEPGNDATEATPGPSTTTPTTTPPKAGVSAPAAFLERSGLCVVCQDEEANIAIVDCGHLAMCRGCSELVMSTRRECPLCRTRIVTEARLLRIFRT